MPRDKDLKRLVRERMATTGERYTEALAQITRQELQPLPPPWQLTGSRSGDYEVGLAEPAVVRLRLRAGVGHAPGFGAIVQGISAKRFRGRRVRYAARMRAHEVTVSAGLWLRADSGKEMLVLDNMDDRPLRGTTGWTPMEIIMDIPEESTSLKFGMLLVGRGAVDLTDLEFHETDQEIPVIDSTLPEEPQNLSFAE
ncbi:hypothetical protein [Nonomuraea sp. SYSU D8015]|uniref:hypothetical protein n=1 Tax=Nonomuraea sp. SYSU D8015 TaxID=2593644 RepID=UPI0016610C42|nr:hypothetical protein [Nonomuraea sp. SYSU D8015]